MNSQPGVRISPDPPLFNHIEGLQGFTKHKTRGRPSGPVLNRAEFLAQSTAKVPHVFQPGLLSIAEAAKRLGKSADTVLRWCERGKLPAVAKPFGNKITFLIPPASVQMLIEAIEAEKKLKQSCSQSHAEYFDAWVLAMQKGLMTGKPFSDSTLEMYEYYAKLFLASEPVVSFQALQNALIRTEASEYCKRFKMYKAVVCFGKFLIRESALDEAFLDAVKPLYPKRHTPPKRVGLDESQLTQLRAATRTPFQKMMVALLVGTGLRVSEAVSLKRLDIDFENQTLIVRKGKGNKSRTLGMSLSVLTVVQECFQSVTSEWVFSDESGQPLTRSALCHRLKRLGNRAGVDVSPHALRRTFVTLNAGKGRPLVYLQKSCGHSDIRTTMSYCLTTEQEVIDAMKGWE